MKMFKTFLAASVTCLVTDRAEKRLPCVFMKIPARGGIALQHPIPVLRLLLHHVHLPLAMPTTSASSGSAGSQNAPIKPEAWPQHGRHILV